MKKMIFSLVAVAMVAVAGVNVYKVSESDVEMLDLQKENVEALATGGEYEFKVPKKGPTGTNWASYDTFCVFPSGRRDIGTICIMGVGGCIFDDDCL